MSEMVFCVTALLLYHEWLKCCTDQLSRTGTIWFIISDKNSLPAFTVIFSPHYIIFTPNPLQPPCNPQTITPAAVFLPAFFVAIASFSSAFFSCCYWFLNSPQEIQSSNRSFKCCLSFTLLIGRPARTKAGSLRCVSVW